MTSDERKDQRKRRAAERTRALCREWGKDGSTENAPGLSMRKYRVKVMTVPPMYEVKAFGAETTFEMREIEGYTLKDAKERAGIS